MLGLFLVSAFLILKLTNNRTKFLHNLSQKKNVEFPDGKSNFLTEVEFPDGKSNFLTERRKDAEYEVTQEKLT